MIASRRRIPPYLKLSRPTLIWAGIALCGIFSTGCQVEYAGMTLPSGKYMLDDVQYFSHGPSFGWANTQAATQRARMAAMGIEPGEAGIATPPNPLMQNQGLQPGAPGTAPVPPIAPTVPGAAPAPPIPGQVPPPANPAGVPPPPGAVPPNAGAGNNE